MAHLHWSFFEMIDEELHTFSRQVEFAEANFPAYSVYLAGLYLSICSEIDVVAKLLCKRIKGDEDPGNIRDIRDYRRIIPAHHDFLPQLKVTVLPVPLALTPWKNWQETQGNASPDWWEFHQKVKHHRDEFFKEANLGNVLKSAAGLLVLLVYWNYNEIVQCELSPNFRVFEIDQRRIPKHGPSIRTVSLPDIHRMGGNKVL